MSGMLGVGGRAHGWQRNRKHEFECRMQIGNHVPVDRWTVTHSTLSPRHSTFPFIPHQDCFSLLVFLQNLHIQQAQQAACTIIWRIEIVDVYQWHSKIYSAPLISITYHAAETKKKNIFFFKQEKYKTAALYCI